LKPASPNGAGRWSPLRLLSRSCFHFSLFKQAAGDWRAGIPKANADAIMNRVNLHLSRTVAHADGAIAVGDSNW
jgi:hypothetical protein